MQIKVRQTFAKPVSGDCIYQIAIAILTMLMSHNVLYAVLENTTQKEAQGFAKVVEMELAFMTMRCRESFIFRRIIVPSVNLVNGAYQDFSLVRYAKRENI